MVNPSFFFPSLYTRTYVAIPSESETLQSSKEDRRRFSFDYFGHEYVARAVSVGGKKEERKEGSKAASFSFLSSFLI